MIELTFGESAAGGLKLAKSMKQGDRMAGPVAMFGGTKKERRDAKKPRIWSGLTMEGCAKDVEALTLALDIGDISDMETGMKARRSLLDGLFFDFPGVSETIWETNRHALARLRETEATAEPIRIWVCESNPAEICGLYFICSLFSNAKTSLSVVRIPTQQEKEDGVIFYRSTGEIPPEELGAFVKYEKPVETEERRAYVNIWHGLVRENAPLRAVVNGKMIGVPDDFYDFALRANIPDEECHVARIIGKTLQQIPGVGDRWLFLRIQALIRSGELTEVSAPTDDHPYSGIVKRNGDIGPAVGLK